MTPRQRRATVVYGTLKTDHGNEPYGNDGSRYFTVLWRPTTVSARYIYGNTVTCTKNTGSWHHDEQNKPLFLLVSCTVVQSLRTTRDHQLCSHVPHYLEKAQVLSGISVALPWHQRTTQLTFIHANRKMVKYFCTRQSCQTVSRETHVTVCGNALCGNEK